MRALTRCITLNGLRCFQLMHRPCVACSSTAREVSSLHQVLNPQQKHVSAARAEKAKKIFPRPTAGPLRPIVHGQTIKYNLKKRLGRGFTFEELKVGCIATFRFR